MTLNNLHLLLIIKSTSLEFNMGLIYGAKLVQQTKHKIVVHA